MGYDRLDSGCLNVLQLGRFCELVLLEAGTIPDTGEPQASSPRAT